MKYMAGYKALEYDTTWCIPYNAYDFIIKNPSLPSNQHEEDMTRHIRNEPENPLSERRRNHRKSQYNIC